MLDVIIVCQRLDEAIAQARFAHAGLAALLLRAGQTNDGHIQRPHLFCLPRHFCFFLRSSSSFSCRVVSKKKMSFLSTLITLGRRSSWGRNSSNHLGGCLPLCRELHVLQLVHNGITLSTETSKGKQLDWVNNDRKLNTADNKDGNTRRNDPPF